MNHRRLARARTVATPLVASVVAVAYGNLATLVFGDDGGWSRAVVGWTFVLAMLGLAMASGLTAPQLGCARPALLAGWRSGVALGLLLGLPFAAAVPVAAAVAGDPMRYGPLEHRSAVDIVLHVALAYPLQTAIPEELVFRGALFGLWQRATSVRSSVAATAVLFALWHGAVAWGTVRALPFDGGPAFDVLAYGAFLTALFAAGISFGLLRAAAGSVVPPMLAHWLAVVPVRLTLWLTT